MLWCFFLPPGISRSLNFCARPIDTGVAISPHKKVTRVNRYIENTISALISHNLLSTEESVSCISESRDNVAMLVKMAVDRCSVNVNVGMLFMKSSDAFRS